MAAARKINKSQNRAKNKKPSASGKREGQHKKRSFRDFHRSRNYPLDSTCYFHCTSYQQLWYRGHRGQCHQQFLLWTGGTGVLSTACFYVPWNRLCYIQRQKPKSIPEDGWISAVIFVCMYVYADSHRGSCL